MNQIDDQVKKYEFDLWTGLPHHHRIINGELNT
jgi:hypothetical protein